MNSNRIIKAASIYTLTNFLLRGINIITGPIFTRMLSTSDYGIVSNFFAWVSIISCFSGMSLGIAVVKGKVDYKDEFNEYLSSVQSLGSVSTVLVSFLFLINLELISDFMNLDLKLIALMLVYLFFFQSVSYAQTNYRYEYKYKDNVIISVLIAILSIVLSFIFIFQFDNSRYIGRILGLAMPMILLGIFFYSNILIKGKCLYNRKYWSKALRLSLPTIPHSLSMIALAQIDRLMITKYIGSAMNGIYSFGYTYATLLSLLTNSINEAIQPKIFDDLKHENHESVRRIANDISLLITFISIMLIGISPEALKILGPKAYYEARWVVLPIILGCYCQFQYQTFACVEVYCNNTKLMSIGSVAAAVVNVGLNALFIPMFGFVAAGYTTFAGYLGLMFFHYWGAVVSYKKNVFDLKQLMIYLVVLFGVGILLQAVFDLFIIRYGFMILISIILWLRKKELIFNLLRNILKK